MALIIDLSAARRRILRLRALRRAGRVDSPLERYKRADLNWQLNPTSGTAIERVTALLAMLAAREKAS